ncbi:hypothetical protein FPCIR_1871 [Fusarium pseudocircinatum]|uniref:CHAT domain-containing protein n=1 Tax=Fusarium pseudocircinatum TaxID=56676 RepID=A0A8H5PSC0_9HYPO|nr:hypothetical protein FPCIR_1871 [Fusarium pseudocircinatum]
MAATKESSARWALLIGINYYPKDRHLHGSVDDVSDIRAYLEQHSTTAIHSSVLTATVPKDHQSTKDPPETPDERPTGANVLKQLRLIIDSAKPGDHVYIHFSGHGTRLPSDGNVGETGFGELGLVLYDNGEHGASYFRGRFLAQALKRMVDKGLVVTVALDCCFSGAVSRGDRVRAMKYDPSLDADRAEQEQECKAALGIPGRDGSIGRDWLVNPEGYTIITACGPHEKAMEVLVNKSQKRGALTHHLLKALTTLAKVNDAVSHQSLHQTVVSMMQASGCSQTPMRYGNTQLSFFGTLLGQVSLTALPVCKIEGSRIFIKAGQIHGISVGDEFTVQSSLSATSGRIYRSRTKYRVANVWAFESELTAAQDQRTSTPAFPFSMRDLGTLNATQLSAVSSQRIKVWLPAELLQNAKLEDKPKALEYYETVTGKDERALCMFELTINKLNKYEIVGEAQDNMLQLPTLDVSLDDALAKMLETLQHIATFKYFEGLASLLPSTDLRAKYTLKPILDSTKSGIFEVLDGGKFGFTIENHADHPLYMAVFDFAPSWDVNNLISASGGGDYVLVPPPQGQNHGMKEMKLKMTVPSHLSLHGQARDVIKVFITDKPVSFPDNVIAPPDASYDAHGAINHLMYNASRVLYNMAPTQAETVGEKLVNSLDGDEARLAALYDHIKQLKNRFTKTADVKHMNESLKVRREILSLIPRDDHENKALQLHLLSNELSDRFAETDDINDMKEAIELGIQALDLTQESDPRKIVFLRRLEFLFEEKYEETEDVADLDELIRYQRLSLDATDPSNTLQMAARLSALAAKLDKRSEVTGKIADVNESIELFKQVVELRPGSESAKKNLIQTLYYRYTWTGEVRDLEECVRLHRQITNPSDTDARRVEWMMTKANHLCILHERTEDENFLEEAFSVADEALALVPEREWKPKWLRCLGRLFGCQYLKTEGMADLEEAIRLERLALKIVPSGEEEGFTLTNLGNRLGDKYLRTNDVADIDEAIYCARKSLDLEPEKPERLYNLAIKLGDRFSRTEDLDDVDEAIELERKALSIMPVDHSERADYLNILGNQLGDRYKHTGDLDDLEEAIRSAEEALSLTPEDHALRAAWLNSLGNHYLNLYTETGDEYDLDQSITNYERALRHETSATEDRIKAGQAILSNSSDSQQLYDTAKVAVSLIPKLVSWSHENQDRQYVLSQVVGLASDAAAAALQAGQSPMIALQLLEQGRGIIGASLQDMRSDMQDLAREHPGLAERYRTLQAELDRRAEHGRAASAQVQASINRRHAAAKEFTELAVEIRMLPGFEDFMLSHTEDEICGASERGPIVVINVSRLRCDALLVANNQVRALALTSTSLEELELKIKPWNLATSQTLEWLWDTIMSPILNKLGFAERPSAETWPHVWWIPTGPLVQLPLHAAGYHRQQWSEAVLDRVISSYGSSIRNIIRGRRDSSQSPSSDQALLVAMEHTPGHDTLTFANEEVELIDGTVRSMKLESIIPSRTKKEVMRYLPDCKIFHFAGHGLAHAEDPSESCLLLEDWERDSLKVSDLLDMNLRQKAPFLAYLSACGTGQIKDETSFDENINLISAFQIAGFRHVIGTLWNVQDDLSVEMAKITYQELLDSDISDESICRGLHKATQELRRRWIDKHTRSRNLRPSIDSSGQETAKDSQPRSVRDAALLGTTDNNLGSADWAPSAAVTELENAVAHFQATLTDDDRKRLQGLKELPRDAQSIIVFTAELDMQQSGKRRGQSIASRLTSFLQIVQQFTPIIDTYIQSNPDISAIIWSSIKLTFMILFQDSARLSDSICEFHTSVILCCEKVIYLIRQSTLANQLWKAITGSFQTEIRTYVENVKAKAENAQCEIELAKAQADHQEQQQQTKERQSASDYRQQLSAWATRYSAAMKDLQDLKEKHAKVEYKKRITLINELTSYNFMPTFNSMRNKRHMGTAEWCFHTTEYKAWANAKESAVLHITGKIGSGKTILVDVLDQLPETHRIKLLLSSRETSSNDIDRILPRATRLYTGRKPTSADIRLYAEDIIMNKISTNELIVNDPGLENEIIEVIHRKEKGMFLWVFLTINDICSRKSDKDIRRALQDIPGDLPATFNRTLGRIAAKKNNIAIVQKAFNLIQASFEPLTLNQLREALSVDIGQQTLDRDDLINGIDRLPIWSESLICIEASDTVHFSHHSIQKYLLTTGSEDFKEFHLDRDKCDRFMGELCVTYISLDNFQRALGFTRKLNTDSSHMNINMGGLAEQTIRTVVGDTIGSFIGRLTREAVGPSHATSAGKVQWNGSRISSIPKHSFGPSQSSEDYTFFEYASKHWYKHQLCIDSNDNEATWRLLGQILRRPRQYSQGEPWFQSAWTKDVSETIGNDVLFFGPGFDSYRETAVSLETDENGRLMNTSTLSDLCYVFIYGVQKRNAGLACRVFMLLVEDYKRPANRRLHGYLSIIINRMAVNKIHQSCENRCLSRAILQLSHDDLVRELRAAVASGISYFPSLDQEGVQQDCTCARRTGYPLREEMCQLLKIGYRRHEQPYLFPLAVLAEELDTGSSVERLRTLNHDKRFDLELMLSSKTRLGRSFFDILIEGALIDIQRMQVFLSERLRAQERPLDQDNGLFGLLGKSNETEHIRLQRQLDNTLTFLGAVQAVATHGLDVIENSLAHCLETGGSVPLHKATITLLFDKILLRNRWPTSICEGIVRAFFGESLIPGFEEASETVLSRAVHSNSWELAASLIDIQPVSTDEREAVGDFSYIKHALRCRDCRGIAMQVSKPRKKWSFDLRTNRYGLCSKHLKVIGKRTDGTLLSTEAKALWRKPGHDSTCDLARPQCRRCITYGAQCPGYRDGLVFRSQLNPTNFKKRDKKNGTLEHSTSPSPSSSSLSTGSSLQATDSVPRSMHQHWTLHSIPIFLNVYSTLPFFHDMYRKIGDGPLVSATHLFSRAYVTVLRQPTAKYNTSIIENDQELTTQLGKTLASVRSALAQPGGAYRDDLLATIWILANYEASSLPCQLLAFQIHSLSSNTECPHELEEWFAIIKEKMPPQEAMVLYVSSFIFKACQVQARIFKILSSSDYNAAMIAFYDIVASIRDARQELRAFAESPRTAIGFFDTYMGNLYAGTCIKVYSLLMALACFLSHQRPLSIPMDVLQSTRNQCINIAQNSAQNVLDTLPRALDTRAGPGMSPKTFFDAVKLVWPLRTIQAMPATSPEQKRIAAKTLTFLGRDVGLKQALNIYTDFYEPLPVEARTILEVDGDPLDELERLMS